jgi:hypothetical protein
VSADNDRSASALLARIDERTENIQHRVRNIEMKFDGYATTRDMAGVSARVDSLEMNQRKAVWAIVTAWIGGLATVGGLLLRKL